MIVEPVLAVTVPATVGRTTSIRVTLNEPSALRFWRNRIVSPTARSLSAIVSPPFVICVDEVTSIVRVQPSTVFNATLVPSIAVISTPPRPSPMPSAGPPKANGSVPPLSLNLKTPRSGRADPSAWGFALAPGAAEAPAPDAGVGDAPIATAALTMTARHAPATAATLRRSGWAKRCEKVGSGSAMRGPPRSVGLAWSGNAVHPA